MNETANRPEGCPNCGSPDPEYALSSGGTRLRPADCPDPYHTPSDSAPEEVWTAEGDPVARGDGTFAVVLSGPMPLAQELIPAYKREAEEAQAEAERLRKIEQGLQSVIEDRDAALSDARAAAAKNDGVSDVGRAYVEQIEAALSDARAEANRQAQAASEMFIDANEKLDQRDEELRVLQAALSDAREALKFYADKTRITNDPTVARDALDRYQDDSRTGNA